MDRQNAEKGKGKGKEKREEKKGREGREGKPHLCTINLISLAFIFLEFTLSSKEVSDYESWVETKEGNAK